MLQKIFPSESWVTWSSLETNRSPQLAPSLNGWPQKLEVEEGRAGETAQGASQRIPLLISVALHSMGTFNNKDFKGFFKEFPGCIQSSIWKKSHETLECSVNTGRGQMRFFLKWIWQKLLSNKSLQQATWAGVFPKVHPCWNVFWKGCR